MTFAIFGVSMTPLGRRLALFLDKQTVANSQAGQICKFFRWRLDPAGRGTGRGEPSSPSGPRGRATSISFGTSVKELCGRRENAIRARSQIWELPKAPEKTHQNSNFSQSTSFWCQASAQADRETVSDPQSGSASTARLPRQSSLVRKLTSKDSFGKFLGLDQCQRRELLDQLILST